MGKRSATHHAFSRKVSRTYPHRIWAMRVGQTIRYLQVTPFTANEVGAEFTSKSNPENVTPL
jgi:hypothetical protein